MLAAGRNSDSCVQLSTSSLLVILEQKTDESRLDSELFNHSTSYYFVFGLRVPIYFAHCNMYSNRIQVLSESENLYKALYFTINQLALILQEISRDRYNESPLNWRNR